MLNGVRLGGVVAAGLGIAYVLLLLLHRPEEQRPAPPQAAAPAPETKTEVPPRPPGPRAPRAVVARTNPPAQPPAPVREPPREPAAEPVVPVEPPPVAAQPEKSDSVLGWGPWAGQSQGSDAGTPAAGERADPSGVRPSVNLAANAGGTSGNGGSVTGGTTTPPVVPPSNDNTRPGYGWGDRNHTHIHRRDR